MTGTYRVMLGHSNVGAAIVERKGLYYHNVCNCVFPEKTIYTISVQSGEHCEYLGVCVPEGNRYKLEKSVPIKRFSANELLFSASRKNANKELVFVPIETGGRFSHLSDLMTAKFHFADNKQGVILCLQNTVQ